MGIMLEDNYRTLAHALHLELGICDRRYFFCGKRGDYDVVVYTCNPKSPYMFTVAIAAGQSKNAMDQQQLNGFAKEHPSVLSLRQKGNRFIMEMKNSNYGHVSDHLSEGLNGLVSFLAEHGYTPCCQICGQAKEAAPYLIEREPQYICPDCAGQAQKEKKGLEQQDQYKEENVAAGIIGAFLGSVLGFICIVLCGKLGYITAISGIVMGICTIKGYELLSGKVTKKGIVFSVMLILIMAYCGDRLGWAMEVSKVWDIGVMEAFKILPELVKEGYIDSMAYLRNLVMLFIFTFGGAIPMMRMKVMERDMKGRVLQIELEAEQ